MSSSSSFENVAPSKTTSSSSLSSLEETRLHPYMEILKERCRDNALIASLLRGEPTLGDYTAGPIGCHTFVAFMFTQDPVKNLIRFYRILSEFVFDEELNTYAMDEYEVRFRTGHQSREDQAFAAHHFIRERYEDNLPNLIRDFWGSVFNDLFRLGRQDLIIEIIEKDPHTFSMSLDIVAYWRHLIGDNFGKIFEPHIGQMLRTATTEGRTDIVNAIASTEEVHYKSWSEREFPEVFENVDYISHMLHNAPGFFGLFSDEEIKPSDVDIARRFSLMGFENKLNLTSLIPRGKL